MPVKEQQTVIIQEGETHSEAVLFLTRFSQQDRVKRGALALLYCWAAAAVAVFIPILHFFLVPVLLLCGPVMFYLKTRQHDSKEKIEGSCPGDGSTMTIELEANAKLPLWTYCPVCKKSIQVKTKTHE